MLTSHVIRDLQITTTMRYNYIPVRMATVLNTDVPNAEENMEGEWYSHFGMVWQFLLKLNVGHHMI